MVFRAVKLPTFSSLYKAAAVDRVASSYDGCRDRSFFCANVPLSTPTNDVQQLTIILLCPCDKTLLRGWVFCRGGIPLYRGLNIISIDSVYFFPTALSTIIINNNIITRYLEYSVSHVVYDRSCHVRCEQSCDTPSLFGVS